MTRQKQPKALRGKVVVITGGGRGIGAATAAALVAKQATVVIADLDLAAAEDTARQLNKEPHVRRMDVTDAAAYTAFLDEVEQTVGPVDVLINNAGIMPLARADEESEATARRQVEINLLAVIHGTKEAVKRMKRRRTGHVVNVASVAGKAGFPGGSTYCATKHAVIGYTDAVRRENRDAGMAFTVVLPAIVRTELAAGLREVNLIKSVQPQDVADAIVAALEFPRFEVYVPKSAGASAKLLSMLPHSFADRLARWLKAENLLAGAAHAPERSAYESRAASSAPGITD